MKAINRNQLFTESYASLLITSLFATRTGTPNHSGLQLHLNNGQIKTI